ncbi:hypothetical protein [Streptomyces sp. NPDC048350]
MTYPSPPIRALDGSEVSGLLLTIAAGAAETLRGGLNRAHSGLGPIAYKD